MVGQQVVSTLASRAHITVLAVQRQSASEAAYFDGSIESLRKVFSDAHADWVINCAGVLSNRIDTGSCASQCEAISVNARLPHEIARCASEFGGRLIHISTDAVFSGRLSAGYDECDKPDPDDFYGMTKTLGECTAPNALTFRCSVIGRDARRSSGLLEWFLGLPPQSSVVGYNDQTWNGVTTEQFAQLCGAIIAEDAFDHLRSVSHVYHFCPNPPITKYDLLLKFRSFSNKDIEVMPGQSLNPRSRILKTRYPDLASYYRAPRSWDEPLRRLFNGA